jgi:DNA polymerase-3 subunit epsilon
MRSVDSYLVIDFETSGLSPQADRIIQVGYCSVVANSVVERGGWLVNQAVRIHPEAQARHGITERDLQVRGISPAESLASLLGRMRGAPTCVGHNLQQFDFPFLLAECGRLTQPAPTCDDFIDTAALYKGWKLGTAKGPRESHRAYAQRVLSTRAYGLKYSIPECLRTLRIREEQAGFHEAGHDAYLTHLIFQALRQRL